jgi:hypothetical protein
MCWQVLAFLCLLFITGISLAGEIKRLELERTDSGFYLINIEMKVEAGKEKVITLLTDYAHLTRLNSQILESERVKTTPDGISEVRTKIRSCGYLFCKTIQQVQTLQMLKNGSIVATILPEQSDFHEGQAKWSFEAEGGSVIIHFQAKLLPRFWVPPLVNIWVMRRMIENEMVETLLSLEKLQPR